MAKNYSRNIYSSLNELTKNYSEILKSMKDMIVHSNRFSEYSRNYNNYTQTTTFMKPEISEYPIIKNTKYIPLNKKVFSFSNEKEKKKKTKKIIPKLLKGFNDTLNNNHSNINIINKKTIPPVLSLKYFYKRKKNYSNNKFDDDKLFLLRNNIFYDESYDNYKYDESEIFHRTVYYNKYIENYIENLKKIKSENLTSFVKREFYKENLKKNTFSLCENEEIISSILFKSMKIIFINKNDKTKKPISFNIPFSYLPIFYFNNMRNVKYILLSCFKFSDDFEKVNFSEEDLYYLIRNSIQYQYYRKKTTSNLQFEEPIKENENEEKTFKKLFFDKKVKVKVTDNNVHKTNRKINPYISKYDNQYNVYYYIWSTPKYKYEVILKAPKLSININKMYITKYVDSELILFLIKRNFLNWDFYIVHYLFSFKSFRWIIQTFLSKNPKNLSLESQYNEENCGFISFNRIRDNLHIKLSKDKLWKINENSHHYMFIYTNEQNMNYLKILHSFSVNISNDLINKKKEFFFIFNFFQMIILNKISKRQKLTDFINKLVYAENSNILLHFDFFENFNKMCYIDKDNNLNDIKENINENKNYSEERRKSSVRFSLSPESIIKKINLFDEKNKFKIEVNYPHIETVEYMNDKNKDYISDELNCIISNDIPYQTKDLDINSIDKLCKFKMEKWPKLIIEFSKNDINILDTYNKKKRKKSSRQTTQKNLRKNIHSPTLRNKNKNKGSVFSNWNFKNE